MSDWPWSARVVPALRDRPLLIAVLALAVVLVADLVRRVATGSLPPAELAGTLWDGLILGMAIGLAGIGLALTYSILSFANFAHGDFVTAGAFAGWTATFVVAGLGSLGLDRLLLVSGAIDVRDLGINVLATPAAIVLGLVVAAVVTALLSLLVDRVVFRPMRDASGVALLIASIGVALVLRHVMLIVYQGGSRGLTQDVPAWDVSVGEGAVSIGAHELTLVVLAGALMLGTHVLLGYTKLGTAMRAMADNEDLARITGIPTERVVRWTWLLGGALTGAAGFLLALESGGMNTTFGWELLLLVFAAVILGGIGSVYGAIVGGLLIGVANSVSIVWLPSDFVLAAAFAVMILMLLVRPQGLLGGVKTV